MRDTGRGISPEVLASLYQPFRRSRSRAGRKGFHFSGTGLGLAMCRKLVEAMGSELAYESRPDWGTRFYFEVNLPLVDRALSARSRAPPDTGRRVGSHIGWRSPRSARTHASSAATVPNTT